MIWTIRSEKEENSRRSTELHLDQSLPRMKEEGLQAERVSHTYTKEGTAFLQLLPAA